MWLRVLLALTVALLTGNGVHMLFAPEHWYHSIDSVAHTGSFNPHFVRDIGCAYLAAALGLALGMWRREWTVPGAATALVFLGQHGGVHLWEAIAGHGGAAHETWIDWLGIYGPPAVALLALGWAVLNRHQSEATS